MLEVRLIGKFEIKCDGKPVIISSRAAQSLFAYLILNAGISHRREKLAGMFWPDTTDEKARAYLRHELWLIRKTFPSTQFLLSDDLGITFDSAADYWLDRDVLEKLTDAASADESIAALAVYQGELLPGFYDDWIILEREHLQVVYEQEMARLLELLESEKRWHEILEWAERWILFGQVPETAYRALMFAYDALGDRAKVASTYERSVQALRALDIEPSEETRSLAFKRNFKLNIPVPLTSFIGREEELKEIAALLSKSRLVTLTGSGGVGKTRLAIQVVADVLDKFPDGVWFLDLAPLNDPALVPNTLANLLGIRESGDTKLSFTDLLINYFRSRTALVVFNNCEHLIESGAQLVHSLLTSCEGLSILATSREALRVSAEIPYRVPSLEIPKPDIEFPIDELSITESVRLFTERAAVASPGFAISPQNVLVVAQICRRLDGIPLAIELAAGRANLLAVEQILERLDDRFNLLTGGFRTALPRHQTLRAMIEWSYNMLLEQERLLFRRLAVFAGGWTLEAAESVCKGGSVKNEEVLNLLGQLINKSLVIAEQTGHESRYHMLETIRQYAREKLLEAGGIEVVRNKHLVYFVKLAEQAEPELYRSNQVFWLNKLEDELDNIRMALEWALTTDAKSGLRLMVSQRFFWDMRGDTEQVGGWLAQLLEHYNDPDSLRVQALALYGGVLQGRGNLTESQKIINQSLEVSRAISDKAGEALSLWFLGTAISFQGNFREGLQIVEQSLTLFQSLGDKLGQALAMGWLSQRLNDLKRSKFFVSESLRLYRELGHLLGIAECLRELALRMIWEGEFSLSVPLLEEAHTIYRQLGNKTGEAEVLGCHGTLAYWKGDYQQAYAYHKKSIELNESLANDYLASWAGVNMAYALLRQGGISKAAEIFQFWLQRSYQSKDIDLVIYTLEGLASLYVNQAQFERATRLFAWTNMMRVNMDNQNPPVEQASIEKDLAVIHSKVDDTQFADLFAKGRALTTEQAIGIALRTVEEM